MAHWLSQKRRVVTALRNEGFILLTMKIETKFNINDKVFIIHKNRVYEGYVRSFHINCESVVGEDNIEYTIAYAPAETVRRTEGYVFSSKEELLKSL